MGIKQLYDTGALYKQNMDKKSQAAFTEFYKELLDDRFILSIHDCSIGAGGSTIPLAKLGYKVSGSDINENLLEKAKQNFEKQQVSAELFLADFRKLDQVMDEKVDTIFSTGNSLPHVDANGFRQFLRSARALLNERGYLFFDLRNWDAIVKERPVMRASDPKVMTAEEHRSLYTLYNWHQNGSVTFTFATCTDKNGRHESIDLLEAPTYYPLCRKDIELGLRACGFQLVQYLDMDELWLPGETDAEKTGYFAKDFPVIQWYGVLAQKLKKPGAAAGNIDLDDD